MSNSRVILCIMIKNIGKYLRFITTNKCEWVKVVESSKDSLVPSHAVLWIVCIRLKTQKKEEIVGHMRECREQWLRPSPSLGIYASLLLTVLLKIWSFDFSHCCYVVS